MSNNADTQNIPQMMEELGQAARRAAAVLNQTSAETRNHALQACANALRGNVNSILEANSRDIETAQQRGLSAAMQDRLFLDAPRIDAIATGLEAVRDLPDPLNRILKEWEQPNGLTIQRVSVPLGVIGMIYESRPNVTADAAGLCLKSGNAVILRGGSESFYSSRALYECLREGLAEAQIDAAAIQMVPTTDRDAVGYLLSSMSTYLDVVVPRGGKGLIKRVQQEARVPVIGHLEGICHVYLHAAADLTMAQDICVNAKMRRTGICGAAETILVDRAEAERLIPSVAKSLQDAGCEIRGDAGVRALAPSATEATEADWSTEYLDAIISMRVVDDIERAAHHIRQFGSGHTECIVTDDAAAAERFFAIVDSAILLHNASTQYADGGEFGMGAEIGIATGRIHARGPVGAEQLTSYKYLVRGSGQTRP